jgi:hypothetical protein
MKEAFGTKEDWSDLTLAQKLVVQNRIEEDYRKLQAMDPANRGKPAYPITKGGGHELRFVKVEDGLMREGDAELAQELWNLMIDAPRGKGQNRALLSSWVEKHDNLSPFIQGLIRDLPRKTHTTSLRQIFGKWGVVASPDSAVFTKEEQTRIDPRP